MSGDHNSSLQAAKQRLNHAAARILAGDRTACAEADDAMAVVIGIQAGRSTGKAPALVGQDSARTCLQMGEILPTDHRGAE